jgi:glutamate/aspartate transport system substrate-binding protein
MDKGLVPQYYREEPSRFRPGIGFACQENQFYHQEESDQMTKAKIFTAVLSCALLSVPVFAQELTGTLKKIKDAGSVTMGHRESSIPFSYYDDKQTVVGYSQEFSNRIVEAIKQELKLPSLLVKMLPITSQNRITLLQNGTIDFECGSTTNNTERQQQVAFSDTIFVIGTRLMTRKDSGIKDFPDLAGKNVVTTAGTTSERLLRKMSEDKKMNMSIISAKDHGESFLTVETGRAVAFMMDDALLAGERAKARKADDWVIVGTPQSYEAYGCMLRKEDPQFKKLVDGVISKLETSGEAEKFYKKWFQSPIPPKGLNLNFELSKEMKDLFKNPNDKAFQ